MLLSQSLLASLEAIINNALHYDPASRQQLSALAGQVLALEVMSPQFTLYLMIEDGGIALMRHWDGTVDARLTGTLVALAKLPFGNTSSLHGTGVSFLGNTALVAGLSKIARTLDIDWEEMLSRVMGDVAAPQVANLVRGNIEWARARLSNFERLSGEFLTYELNAIPSRHQLHEFYQQVDALRFDLDRVQSKLRLLTATNKSAS